MDNKIILKGVVLAKPMKIIVGEKKVIRFRVRTERNFNGRRTSETFSAEAWSENTSFEKGSKVEVTGRMKHNFFTDSKGHKAVEAVIVADLIKKIV